MSDRFSPVGHSLWVDQASPSPSALSTSVSNFRICTPHLSVSPIDGGGVTRGAPKVAVSQYRIRLKSNAPMLETLSDPGTRGVEEGRTTHSHMGPGTLRRVRFTIVKLVRHHLVSPPCSKRSQCLISLRPHPRSPCCRPGP